LEKLEMALILFLGAWGDDDSWKKPEAKTHLVTLSLKIDIKQPKMHKNIHNSLWIFKISRKSNANQKS
jgi:hypothetical protein